MTCPRVILLDFDGTVVDTMSGYEAKAAELISRATGMTREEALRFYRETAGRAFRDQLRLAGVPEDLVEPLAREFEEYKRELLSGVRIDPLTRERIEALRGAGLRVYLSTNNECNVISTNAMLASLFDGVLCYDAGRGLAKGEPHLRVVMRREGVEPGEIVFIGDSQYDIDLYRGLGTHTIRTRGLWRPDDDAVERVLGLAGRCRGRLD